MLDLTNSYVKQVSVLIASPKSLPSFVSLIYAYLRTGAGKGFLLDRPLIPLPVGGGGLFSLPLRGRGRGGVRSLGRGQNIP